MDLYIFTSLLLNHCLDTEMSYLSVLTQACLSHNAYSVKDKPEQARSNLWPIHITAKQFPPKSIFNLYQSCRQTCLDCIPVHCDRVSQHRQGSPEHRRIDGGLFLSSLFLGPLVVL